MKIAYVERQPPFRAVDLAIIETADAIASDLAGQGYTLTLRQLYYQFIHRNLMPNNERSYDRLGRLVEEGRKNGLIDWDHIVDRTRRFESVNHWADPAAILRDDAEQFHIDKWIGQPYRPEAWVEKEALIDVIAQPARRWDLTWFAARGYASASSQHVAAMRFVGIIEAGQTPVILHLGDHDPSGIDMTRDIFDRINLFVRHHTGETVEVRRLALNMNQVRENDIPPNPAKTSDARFKKYLAEYGDESWELDALDPPTIDGLIEDAVTELLATPAWLDKVALENEHRDQLATLSERWDDVAAFIEDGR